MEDFMINKILLICVGILLFITVSCQKKQVDTSFTITYEALIESPVEIPPGKINEMGNQVSGKMSSKEESSLIFQKTPAIFFSKDDEEQTTYCTILKESVESETVLLDQTVIESPFTFQEQDNGSLLLLENDEPIMAYQYMQQIEKGVPKRYKRSTYVHPLYDLSGRVLTDDFPKDHYHHRGLSWNWPKVWVNEKRYDLWHIYGIRNELDGIHQIFDKWTIKEKGPVCLLLGAKNHWETDNGQKVMDEEILFRVFRKTTNGRAIDVQLKWTAIESIKISGQDKKGYGGFNLRFAPRENTQITSQSGTESTDSNLRTYAWVDFSAQFENQDEYSGAAIFQHPWNQDFPAGWVLRYYGYIGVAWPGIEVLELNPGESFTMKFRIWVHDGNVTEGDVEKAYDAYQGQFMLED